MSSVMTNPTFPVQGPVISIAEMIKNHPDMAVSPAEIKEGKLFQEQLQQQQTAINRYIRDHPDPMTGQVVLDGKVVATVFSSGGTAIESAIAGLSQAALSPAERLAEIARLTGGEIRRTDFLPSSSKLPDDVMVALPQITARPFGGRSEELYLRTR